MLGKIGDQLDQYDAYIEKISSAPVPMKPSSFKYRQWTYDMGNKS